MVTVKESVKLVKDPIQRNDLEARRRRLGLSRVALGRILGVDPATVFRRERGPLAALWDYALRGIEAEARDKASKHVLHSYKSGLDHQSFMPDQLAARGYSYTAEKMRKAAKESHGQHPPRPPRASKLAPAPSGRRSRELTPAEITAAADRAEARSKPSG